MSSPRRVLVPAAKPPEFRRRAVDLARSGQQPEVKAVAQKSSIESRRTTVEYPERGGGAGCSGPHLGRASSASSSSSATLLLGPYVRRPHAFRSSPTRPQRQSRCTPANKDAPEK